MRSAAVLTLALALSAPLAGQRADDPPPNAPETCPYTGGDPELLAAAGVVSLGGFEFGTTDTAGVDELLPMATIRWIETEHFELGFGLSRTYQVKQEERDKVRTELAELAVHWPEVNPKARRLDPWLRAHLHAQRLERVYARFQEIVQVTDADFPDGTTLWDMTGKYMGAGPYLGQKGKYEVLVLPSEAASVMFLRDSYGLSTPVTQRWNIVDRDTLQVVTHDDQEGMNVDAALHGHLAFNVAINLLDGFKHYSYETPIWLREGLAHFIEREIDPHFNSFDQSEGSAGVRTRKWRWESEVLKMVRGDEAPRMAQLARLKTYAQLELEHHYASWSITDFLIRVRPDAYACLTDALHGRTNPEGQSDGTGMDDAQREAVANCLGMSYVELDQAWLQWVVKAYSGQ